MSSITEISIFTKPYPAHSQANTDQTRDSLLEVAHKTFGSCYPSNKRSGPPLLELPHHITLNENKQQKSESLLYVAHKTFGASDSSTEKTATSLFKRVHKGNLAENRHPNYELRQQPAHTTFQADSSQSVRVTDIRQAPKAPFQISQQSAFKPYASSQNLGKK
ncbi:MAG: hypothetical protein NT065_00175 [Chlamydiae bacterium]|nr:hypothetical protein [Chlamydiota bacterium]